MIRNNLKPKFYSNHRTRNRIRSNSFNEKELFFQAQEALRQRRKVFLEVGFGDGKSVIDMANKNPEVSFFCIETYSKGLSLLTEKIQEKELNNIFMLYGDAIEIVEKLFNNKTIDKIYVFFPDIWPKRKHKKRRLINTYTVNLFFMKLKKNGIFHFATDNINYAYETRSLISNYFSTEKKVAFSHNRGDRPITKYEKKALTKKNIIYDLIISN